LAFPPSLHFNSLLHNNNIWNKGKREKRRGNRGGGREKRKEKKKT